MKLQISYDFTDLDKALEIAKQTAEYADVIEIGSLVLSNNGMHVVEEFKKKFPKNKILADTKLVDRVEEIIRLLCKPADLLTVLAGTDNDTIREAVRCAHACDIEVVLDLLDAPSREQSAHEAQTLGVDSLLFHNLATPTTALADLWAQVKENTSLPIFITDAIDRNNIDQILQLSPSGIVIGDAITKADNPAQEAAFFKSLL